jgi:hypothetical protein
MSSPEGWAYSNMWYDTCRTIPEHGTPLESVLLLVFLERQHAALLHTRTLVQAQMANIEEKEQQEVVQKAYQDLSDSLFSFLSNKEGETKKSSDADYQRLMKHVAHPLKIDLRPVAKGRIQQTMRRLSARQRMGVRRQEATPTPERFAPRKPPR